MGPQYQLSSSEVRDIDKKIRMELRQFRHYPGDSDDLVSEAWVRILKHIDKFDKSIAKLSTFISYHARGAFLDYIRANYAPRTKNLEYKKQLFNDTVRTYMPGAVDTRDSLIDQLALNSSLDVIEDSREKLIIYLYLDGHTLREIADKLGVTESRVSQIISSIIEGLVDHADYK